MNQLRGDRFDPLPPTDEEKEERKKIHKERQSNIKAFVDDKKLTKLKCDYFGMDSYYDNITPQVYKVCNIGGSKPNFVLDNNPHILKLNNLPIINGYVKKCNWLNINTHD